MWFEHDKKHRGNSYLFFSSHFSGFRSRVKVAGHQSRIPCAFLVWEVDENSECVCVFPSGLIQLHRLVVNKRPSIFGPNIFRHNFWWIDRDVVESSNLEVGFVSSHFGHLIWSASYWYRWALHFLFSLPHGQAFASNPFEGNLECLNPFSDVFCAAWKRQKHNRNIDDAAKLYSPKRITQFCCCLSRDACNRHYPLFAHQHSTLDLFDDDDAKSYSLAREKNS